ncbi:MAG: T9SS type A sorting domain-containing protein [Ignavibacteria bacterium]|nr:T9SS type A sorting domain-containing protein [Ignavibacteria bacterium]
MKNIYRTALVMLLISAGLFIFQGSNSWVGWDDDPNLDRVPYEYFLRNMNKPHQEPVPFVLTTSDGYDNFNVAIDLAEGHISINPTNPLNAFVAFNGSGSLGSVPTTTTNGGINWFRVNPVWGSTMTGDPVTAYDSVGNAYFENMWSNPIIGTKIAKSTDGTVTWSNVANGNAGNDKNWIAADQTGGPYKDHIYSAMTNGASCNVARSTDKGATWNVVTALVPHGLPGAMPCVGPNGNIQGGSVYVVTNAGSSFSPVYSFFRSTDGGATFSQQSQVSFANCVGDNVGGRNSVQNMRTRPYPFISADNSYGPNRGRLHLIYASNTPVGCGNKPDIFSRYSTDFGVTWSAEKKVNDDANSENNNQWHPAMWCDKQTGRLWVQWLDTRNTPTSDSCEVYATYSDDGGATFVPNVKISNAKFKINCTSCGGAGTPLYLGDYNGINSVGNMSMLCWADFRSNNFQSTVAYFPDYAVKTRSTVDSLAVAGQTKDYYVTIPSVKLYTGNVKFSASLTTPPAAGGITIQFLNKTTNLPQDSLTTYPDSIKMRVSTTPGTSTGNYTLNIKTTGTGGMPPVHLRSFNIRVHNPIGITPIGTNVPTKFDLLQNYPNPFNPVTNIKFDIAKTGLVKLSVYDVTGRQVADLVNGELHAGSYNYDFNASNLASGIYFYKLEAGNFTSIKKMILVK